MVSICIIILCVVIWLLCNCYKVRRQVGIIGSESLAAIGEFEMICTPNRFFSDEEAQAFLENNNRLAIKIKKIHKSFWIKKEEREQFKFDKFLNIYDEIQNFQRANNSLYRLVVYVNQNIDIFIELQENLRTIYHSNHIIESHKNKCKEILSAINKLKSKNALQYVNSPTKAKDFVWDFSELTDSHNIKLHNDNFVERKKNEHEYFFNTCLNYPLDNQQREAILHLEDNTLVISSAGSGKTSTMVGKARYMIEKEGIDPSKILIITYTRKAAGELSERLGIDNLSCSTFHALALKVISGLTGKTPTICDAGFMLNAFYSLLHSNSNFKSAINQYIMEERSLMKFQHDYDTAEEYYRDRKKYGIQAMFKDRNGKIIFTKSEEEKRICEWLSLHNIEFSYEEEYEFSTSDNRYRQYKPDFSIYYRDNNGTQKRIYLEHFAIDRDGKVPLWFGTDYNNSRQDDFSIVGRWEDANRAYNDGILWKQQLHVQNGTTLIYTTSAMFHDRSIWRNLEQSLRTHGVPYVELTPDQLYQKLVDRDRRLESSVYKLLEQFTTLQKSNMVNIDDLIALARQNNDRRSDFIISDVMKPFVLHYNQELRINNQIDFTDAILQATELAKTGQWLDYDYILVDEFQDISKDRYLFLNSLRKNNENCFSKLFCVGDDWQSIYRFSGSDMSLFYDFETYFGFTRQCKIETTYRFHEPLIGISSGFIKKNPYQERKEVKAFVSPRQRELEDRLMRLEEYSLGDWCADADYEFQRDINQCEVELSKFKTEISCISYIDDNDEKRRVENLIQSIPVTEDILIIGRYNYDVKSLGFEFTPQDADRRAIYLTLADRRVRFMSVHSSKGLESDHVILINCNSGTNGFPSLIEDDPILSFVLSDKDQFENAEERRVFYVAITRAKKHMYVFYNDKNPSVFVNELNSHNGETENGYLPCPECGQGYICPRREGTNSYGDWVFVACSNYAGGCRYHKFMDRSRYLLEVDDFNSRNSQSPVQEMAKQRSSQIRDSISRVHANRTQRVSQVVPTRTNQRRRSG